MNMSFFNGAVGMQQQMARMNVQANNIANVNTQGYKAERATFAQLMYRDVIGIDGEELPKGTGTRMIKASIDLTNGSYRDTGRTYDFAIEGDGFFALYAPSNGEISFTRDGSFTITQFWVPPDEDAEPEIDPETGEEIPPQPTQEWRLSDNEGRCVLDSNGNFIRVDLDDKEADLDVGVFDYAIRDGILHLESSRFVPIEKNGDLYRGTGTVRRGMLEMSNTDLAQEFIKVIESQRAYTAALRVVTSTDEIETTINNLR